MKVLPQRRAVAMGYSPDKRRRRREHRQSARQLIEGGTFLSAKAPRGTIPHSVAQWHLHNARWVGR